MDVLEVSMLGGIPANVSSFYFPDFNCSILQIIEHVKMYNEDLNAQNIENAKSCKILWNGLLSDKNPSS